MVVLIGRLTRDPELRYLPSGTALCTFGIATNRSWTDKNTNDKKEEVMFIDITTFARSAEIANQYLKKGNKVLVEGRLALEQWNDQYGKKRSRHVVKADTIQFMETKVQTQANQQNDYTQSTTSNHKSQTQPHQQSELQTQEHSMHSGTKDSKNDIDNNEEIPF